MSVYLKSNKKLENILNVYGIHTHQFRRRIKRTEYSLVFDTLNTLKVYFQLSI